MVKIGLRWLPVLYMVAIFIMSSNPADAVVEFPKWDGIIKESLHLVEFGILYVLLVLALLTFKELSGKWNVICILIASLYGISDEIHQSFVPYRSATMIDVIKDIIGVLVASWVIYGAYQKKRFIWLEKALSKIERGA